MTRWEYKKLPFDDRTWSVDEAALAELGSVGWELVCTDSREGFAYFKRPIHTSYHLAR